MSQSLAPSQESDSVFSTLDVINEAQSFIPSCMKCVYTLDVKTDGSLKVNSCTLILTGNEANTSSKEWIKEEEEACFNHITVQEVDNLDSEIELAKAPEILKDGA